MHALRRTFIALLATLSLPALADSDGGSASVGNIAITTNSTTTAGFLMHGSTAYYWGSALCSGVTTLSQADIDRLFTARLEGMPVNVWYTTPVSPSYRCLTAYRIN